MIFDFANKAVGDKTGLVEQWHGINYQNPESAPSQDLESAQSKQWQKLWGGSATEEVDHTITKVAYLIFRSIHSLQNCKKKFCWVLWKPLKCIYTFICQLLFSFSECKYTQYHYRPSPSYQSASRPPTWSFLYFSLSICCKWIHKELNQIRTS